MTYAFSWPLQQALFEALLAHAGLRDIVGERIFDEPPHAAAALSDGGPWILIGDEQVDAWSTATDRGAAHAVQVSVFGVGRGFSALKRAAAIVCDIALSPLALSRGQVINASFLGGRTRRAEGGALRQIDLRFRLVVEDAL